MPTPAYQRARLLLGRCQNTHAAVSIVATMAERDASRVAWATRRSMHAGQRSTKLIPATNLPHSTQGTSRHPAGDGIAEFSRAGRSAQVARAHLVGDDRGDNGPADPVTGAGFTN